tara:strand:- start:61 stop:549 length:489 start_codon:yes stop_codon:yes gene_type:complete
MDSTNNYYILTFLFGHGETASGRITVFVCFLLSLILLSILGIFLSKKNVWIRKICNVFTLIILFIITLVFFINIRWQILDMNNMGWFYIYISGLGTLYVLVFFSAWISKVILKKFMKTKDLVQVPGFGLGPFDINLKSNCANAIFPLTGILLGLIFISIRIL